MAEDQNPTSRPPDKKNNTTQVMSTVTANTQFAIAAAAADGLRAEEPAFAWINDYQDKQPEKTNYAKAQIDEKLKADTALAEQKKQDIEDTQPITESDIETLVSHFKGQGVSEQAMREVAHQFLGASKGSAQSQMREAIAELILKYRAESIDKGDLHEMTPEEKFNAALNDYVEKATKANEALHAVHEAGGLSDELMARSDRELAEIKKLQAEREKLQEEIKNAKSDEEKELLKQQLEEKEKLLLKKIEEHDINDKKAYEEARKWALENNRPDLVEMLDKTYAEKELSKLTLDKEAQDDKLTVKADEQVKDSQKVAKNDFLDEEPEVVVVPQLQDQTASVSKPTGRNA